MIEIAAIDLLLMTTARELVTGDVIHVRLGGIVPADATLLDGNYLLLDESALTGESLPDGKRAADTIYSDSIVCQGEMDAVVTFIRQNTNFRKTTLMLQDNPQIVFLRLMVNELAIISLSWRLL